MGMAALGSGKTVYSVGYNVDMLSVAPNAALTSPQNNWGVHYLPYIKARLEGTEMPSEVSKGYADDGVMISPLGPSCAAGTQEAVDKAIAGLKDGSIQVFDTKNFTVGGETLTTFPVMGDSDGDWVPETNLGEAIENGAFIESKLRSAPYFSLRIDGITELNNN